MTTPTAPVHDYSHPGSSFDGYTSMMLQMYVENLNKYSTAQVLDVGPVCEENITYFAQRIKRIYVCDMFLRLSRNRHKDLPTEKVWEHLDYAPNSFDGINLWDFIDHLNDDDIGRLVNLCHTALEPGGMMMVTSFEEQSTPSKIHSFVIKDSYRLNFRLQNHLDLPRYYRSNRIISDMLSEFQTVNSFIYRNGVREFLCRRD
ncbi:MAG: class I SAM-dependent methyltransferase [Deltaproteobacteria bacterium]|nr:class I SAM-dependent methyltransferase [Deltaproteobacteria bacterium]